jgi:zinc transport system substrate-binding protein
MEDAMRHSLALVCAMMATPLAAQEMKIVTDFGVTQSLVSMVLGDMGQAGMLLDRGANAHSFQLRPSQAQALADADVVIWMGPRMSPWLERALEGVGGTAHRLALLDVSGVALRNFGQAKAEGHDGHDHAKDANADDHDHDHAKNGKVDSLGHDDHGHEDHGHDDHGHDDHGHDDHWHDDHDSHDHADGDAHAHSGLDPHAWLNTGNAKVWLDAIAAELSEHDAANAATYAANADAAKAQIDALTAEVAATLAPLHDMPLVMFHDAYGYLADQFDLTIAGTIALGDAAEPGAQRLTELRAHLAEKDVACVFPEVNHSSRYITVVLEGTDVRLGAELDPEGSLLDLGADLYPTLLRNMAQAIADCVAG